MGALKDLLPQGPKVHCGVAGSHVQHPNPQPEQDTAWCDGVPQLEAFTELTIRVPLGKEVSHQEVLSLLSNNGLLFFVDSMDHERTKLVMRVRTGDKDKVYPIIKRPTGLTAVVTPDEHGE